MSFTDENIAFNDLNNFSLRWGDRDWTEKGALFDSIIHDNNTNYYTSIKFKSTRLNSLNSLRYWSVKNGKLWFIMKGDMNGQG